MSTILSACYLLSLLLVQTFASVAMGQITMRTGMMKPQIVFGFTVWWIGQGLISLFNETYGALNYLGLLLWRAGDGLIVLVFLYNDV